MATIEELTGVVKGLADVVKSQQLSQHDAQEANRQHIDALAKKVSEMATHSASSSNLDTLNLPQLVLHRNTGKPEALSRCSITSGAANDSTIGMDIKTSVVLEASLVV